MGAKLLVDGPHGWAYTYQLEPGKVARVGRAKDNEIPLTDPAISSRHAEFVDIEDVWRLKDLNSHNGTRLNGKEVKDALLNNGDVLNFGPFDVVFQQKGAQPKAERERWDHTRTELAMHLKEFRNVAESRPASESVVYLPELLPASKPADLLPESVKPIGDPESFESDWSSSNADVRWVAEKVAEVLDDVLTTHADRYVMFAHIMGRLRTAIGADNGFLMLPEASIKRWVIRAWVGDPTAWTDFSKKQPVPLTAVLRAHNNKKVESNSLGGSEESHSASMKALKVNAYIALPLLHGGESHGVLYFDTRQSGRSFTVRDLLLLDRIGGYILEIEKQGA